MDLNQVTVINQIYQSETIRLKVIPALQNAPAQFETFFMNQSPVKSESSIPDTVGYYL